MVNFDIWQKEIKDSIFRHLPIATLLHVLSISLNEMKWKEGKIYCPKFGYLATENLS